MKPIRKTIVNCGVSHVSACVFAKGDDGALILEQTEVEILQYDYSNESLWLDALADGLEKLVGHGIGKGEAHFILAGQSFAYENDSSTSCRGEQTATNSCFRVAAKDAISFGRINLGLSGR